MIQTGTRIEKESTFQSKAIEYIQKRGGYVVKVHVSAYQKQGVPDLIVCYMGMFVAFELKAKRGTAKQLQLFNKEQIQHAGGTAKVVKTLKEIEDTLDEIFRIRQDNKS